MTATQAKRTPPPRTPLVATGIDAKLVVVATTATPFTIADPSDAGMMDVVGMSTDVPAVMADFARG